MQRLPIVRMPISFKLGALLLTAACGDAAGPSGDAQQAPAVSDTAATEPAVSSAAKPAQSGQAGSPSSNKPAPAASGTAGTPASTATAATTTSPPASPTAAAGGGAQVPDGQGSAGKVAEQPAAGSGGQTTTSTSEGAAGASEGAAGGAAPMGMLTEDGIDPLNPDWSKRTDLGKGDGSDVVTIGDSWMDYIGGGGGIQAGLDRAGFRYRHYALSGTTLLSGQIPSQYTQAKSVNPDIKTIIMTGGGNDVMFSGGCNTEELCEMSVMRIQEGLQELWSQMADDGVKDVIYIQYSEDAGTAPMGTRPKSTKPVPICLTGRILCHSVPTTELVMGQLVDGIHPTAGANDRIAAELVKIMEQRKMRR